MASYIKVSVAIPDYRSEENRETVWCIGILSSRRMKLLFTWTMSLVWVLIKEPSVKSCSTRDHCKRKQYTAVDGFYHVGKLITRYEDVTLDTCVKSCRKYLECRSFNMKWTDEVKRLGSCELLEDITIATVNNDGIPDDSSTHYCKLI